MQIRVDSRFVRVVPRIKTPRDSVEVPQTWNPAKFEARNLAESANLRGTVICNPAHLVQITSTPQYPWPGRGGTLNFAGMLA